MSKIWETEFMALNFNTAELEARISPHYFEGNNFTEAQKSLLSSGMSWVRLTGKSYKDYKDLIESTREEVTDKVEEIKKAHENYELVVDPETLTEGMDVWEFIDWLNLSNDLKDILETLKAFRAANMEEYVKVILGHLKHKYGYEEEN